MPESAIQVVNEALQFFGQMRELHLARWTDLDKSTSLAADAVVDFHRRLIRALLPSGGVDLLRVGNATQPVGFLYNFVSRGEVLFSQSGLAYETDGKLKPGLVCHALAIDHAARAGHRWYDFLAGQSRYKQSLATDARALVWARIQKPRLRFALEDLARSVRNHVRARRAMAPHREGTFLPPPRFCQPLPGDAGMLTQPCEAFRQRKGVSRAANGAPGADRDSVRRLGSSPEKAGRCRRLDRCR